MNTAGIQKLFGIDKAMEQTKKAARIPIPPPFGVTISCELRKFGLSKSDSLNPHFAIIHAPDPPSKNDIKYSIGSNFGIKFYITIIRSIFSIYL
jgi:hypothetical protein